MNTLVAALGGLFILHVVNKILQVRKAFQATGNHPGDFKMFTDFGGVISIFVPFEIPWVTPGRNRLFKQGYTPFRKYGSDVISYISSHPVRTTFFVADPDLVREITSARARFPKPVEIYSLLDVYGRNIVVSEGDEWKRFRRVSSPSFSERNNKLVWDETRNIVLDLFENVWGDRKVVDDEDPLRVTTAIALYVISLAGFGQRISWKDEGERRPGFQMSFKEAIYYVSAEVFAKLATPAWLLNLDLTTKLRNTRIAYDELQRYILDMMHRRRNAEEREERYDLLSSLLDASEAEGKSKLTDQELVGNIFVFLIAGHETTAHTLCFAFALLALYQDEQDRLFEHIKSVLPDGRLPNYEDMSSLTYSMAVVNETLRHFPPAPAIPKVASDDMVLMANDASGEKVPVCIPKGADLVIHTTALHHHPRYWEDPDAFKPSRFLKPDWPRDAFLPFSGGPRACIGRRFAEVEAVAVLTLFVMKYRLRLKEEPQHAHETFEQKKARILAVQAGLTITPGRIPLVFERRV